MLFSLLADNKETNGCSEKIARGRMWKRSSSIRRGKSGFESHQRYKTWQVYYLFLVDSKFELVGFCMESRKFCIEIFSVVVMAKYTSLQEEMKVRFLPEAYYLSTRQQRRILEAHSESKTSKTITPLQRAIEGSSGSLVEDRSFIFVNYFLLQLSEFRQELTFIF